MANIVEWQCSTCKKHLIQLLYKLKAIGFNKEALKWIQSYLSGRVQMADVGRMLSGPKTLNCGVPRGSILRPLLFLLYINDMKAACSCPLFLYADDSALLVTGECLETTRISLGKELQKVSSWLCDNKLSLHLDKTECIVFGSRHKLRDVTSFTVE